MLVDAFGAVFGSILRFDGLGSHDLGFWLPDIGISREFLMIQSQAI